MTGPAPWAIDPTRLDYVDRTIKSLYPSGGSRAVRDMLPDLSPGTIQNRARRLGITTNKSKSSEQYKATKPENDVEYEAIKRACLRCKDEFTADGRYIRLCTRCKQSVDWHDGSLGFNGLV